MSPGPANQQPASWWGPCLACGGVPASSLQKVAFLGSLSDTPWWRHGRRNSTGTYPLGWAACIPTWTSGRVLAWGAGQTWGAATRPAQWQWCQRPRCRRGGYNRPFVPQRQLRGPSSRECQWSSSFCPGWLWSETSNQMFDSLRTEKLNSGYDLNKYSVPFEKGNFKKNLEANISGKRAKNVRPLYCRCISIQSWRGAWFIPNSDSKYLNLNQHHKRQKKSGCKLQSRLWTQKPIIGRKLDWT